MSSIRKYDCMIDIRKNLRRKDTKTKKKQNTRDVYETLMPSYPNMSLTSEHELSVAQSVGDMSQHFVFLYKKLVLCLISGVKYMRQIIRKSIILANIAKLRMLANKRQFTVIIC